MPSSLAHIRPETIHQLRLTATAPAAYRIAVCGKICEQIFVLMVPKYAGY